MTENSDEFAIVLVTGYPKEIVDDKEDFRPEFLAALADDVAATVDSEFKPVSTGYGYGADTLALALVFSTLTAAFLSGKSVRDNADAWVDIGRRFLALTKRLGRINVPRISEPVALSIAMAVIADREKCVPPIGLVSRVTTRVRNGSLTEEAQRQFVSHPDRYYVFTVELVDKTTHVLAISSRGEVMFHHELSLEWPKFLKLKDPSADI